LVKQASAQGLSVVRSRLPGLRVFGSLYCCFINVFNDPTKGMYAPPDGPSPMADVRVRKALNKAINRDDLNKAFFGGKGEPMYANHLHPSRPGWNAEYERRFPEAYGYDVNAARALLAEAGYTASNPMEAYISLQEAAGIAGSNDISEAIGQYWTAIGVKVLYEQGDAAARTVLRRERKQTNHFGLTGTAAAPLIGLVWNSTSGGRNSNFSGAQDVDLENVVKRLYDTIETEKQEPLFRQAGEIVFAKYLSVPLFWLRAEAVVNPKIVADYSFSGTISGTWTHTEYIKAAK
jgi:peptide/nickel transport system substrate-binding protein